MKQTLMVMLCITSVMHASELPVQKLIHAKAKKAAGGQYDFSIPEHIVMPLAGEKQGTLCCIAENGHYCLYDVNADSIVDSGKIPLGSGYFIAAAIGSPVCPEKLVVGLASASPAVHDELLNIFDLNAKKIESKRPLKLKETDGRGRQRGNLTIPLACSVTSLVALPTGEIVVDVNSHGYCGRYNAQGVLQESLLIPGKRKIVATVGAKEQSYLVMAATPDDSSKKYDNLSMRLAGNLQEAAWDFEWKECLTSGRYDVSTTHDTDIIISSKDKASVGIADISPAGEDIIDDSQLYGNNRYKSFGKLIPMSNGDYVSLAHGLMHTWKKQQAEPDEGKEEEIYV